MLIENLIKATVVEMQGFRVTQVTVDVSGLIADFVPDRHDGS